MTKQKEGGSSRPTSPQAPPKRPQVRPVAGAKPPILRPIAVRPATAPRPPANVKRPRPEPLLGSLGDEESTSVMDRAPFDTPRALPASLETVEAFPPPATARTGRPPVDVVPPSQRSRSERTLVMPNAPPRARSTGSGIVDVPAESRTSKSSRPPPKGSAPSSARSPMQAVTPLDALIPPAPRQRSSDRPREHTGTGHASLGSLARARRASAREPASSPPQALSPALPDETQVMHRGAMAPPVGFPPPQQPPHPLPPPAAVPPMMPPSTVAPAPEPVPLPMPAAASAAPQPALAPVVPEAHAQGPNVLGFIFFAAPLALGTAIVAVLALV